MDSRANTQIGPPSSASDARTVFVNRNGAPQPSCTRCDGDGSPEHALKRPFTLQRLGERRANTNL
eukprot:5827552-Pleurochrysis_carterae.AAC.1